MRPPRHIVATAAIVAIAAAVSACPRRPALVDPTIPPRVVPGLPTVGSGPDESRFVPTDAYYQFVMGRLAAEGGDCERAIDHFRQAASHDPESSYVHQVCAECLLRLGRIQDGLQEAERAVAIDETNLDAKLLLSRAYLVARDAAAAERLLEEILSAAPEDRAARELLAEIALQRGDEQRAIELIESIADSDPDDARATFFLGQLFLQRGLLERAVDFFLRTLERDPGHSRAHQLLISVYERQLLYQEAAAAATRYAELHLGEIDPLVEQVRLLARAKEREALTALLDELRADAEDDQLVEVAAALARGGDERGALALLREVVQRRPDLDAAHAMTGRVQARRGELTRAIESFDRVKEGSRLYPGACAEGADVLLRLGRPSDAVLRLERAIELSPDTVDLRIQLADVEARLGHRARALAVVEEIPESQRETPRVISARSRALAEAGRDDQAIASVLRAMATRPDDPEMLLVLALAHERAGRHAEAEGAARQLLAGFPDSVAAQNFLAYTYALRDERLEEALVLAQRASAAAPEDGYIADTLGFVLLQQGRTEEAREVLRRANAMSPDEPEILLHLGDAERALGSVKRATRLYRRALELRPRQRDVRAALQSRLSRGEVHQ